MYNLNKTLQYKTMCIFDRVYSVSQDWESRPGGQEKFGHDNGISTLC